MMKRNLNYSQASRHFGLNPFGDIDRDKVPNRLDCCPYNSHLQHVTPNQAMQARLKKLPIYFTTSTGTIEEIVNARKFYSLYDKNVPKEIEILKQRFYSMIKKRPDTIGKLEKTRPRAIFFTKRGMETLEEAGYTQYMTEPTESIEKGKLPGRHIAIVRLSSPHRGYPYRDYEIQHSAGTTIHELEHIKQYKKWEGKPKLAKRMRKGPYSKKREEILATAAEEKAYRKRYKFPRTKSQIYRGFRKLMEN